MTRPPPQRMEVNGPESSRLSLPAVSMSQLPVRPGNGVQRVKTDHKFRRSDCGECIRKLPEALIAGLDRPRPPRNGLAVGRLTPVTSLSHRRAARHPAATGLGKIRRGTPS